MSKFAALFLGETPGAGENQSSKEESNSYTILFVDDEENVLSALRRVFRRENYKALTAKGGIEALNILAQEPVQVVVSDFKMPEMDGAAFLRAVKDKYPQTIRIMLTGYADVGAIMGAVNEGAVYKFITKPWNDDDLRLTVSLALEQYDLIKENKFLKEKKREAEQKIKSLSRLTSAGQSNLGKMLVRRGALTNDQLGKAVELQGRTKETLPSVLIKLGYVDESTIFGTIKKELNIDVVSLAEFNISDTLFELIPESYCRQNYVLPLRLEDKKLTLAMADPTDFYKVDDLRFVSGLNIIPVLARVSEITSRLDQLTSKDVTTVRAVEEFDPYENIEVIEEEEECDIKELLSSAETPPAIRLVNAIISESISMGASDIHIEPKSEYSRVRFRVDGLLIDKIHLPSSLHASTVSRIKVMAGMDISERRKPQDGRVTVKSARKIVDLRVSSLPTISGEKVVLRLLDRNASV
ncbi:MAG: ATPase, T2SS/T4P/T4SS family, partial [Deltaproteobacteria bacterium]|nr:ATPase, T2SS/T4P/T4SS family [Deltaproteobacteria bacterium]